MSTTASRIGLIGLGEAGSAIGAGLRDNGLDPVLGYDVRAGEPEVARRADSAGIELTASLYELAHRCDVMICLTSARSALDVAAAIAPRLTARHVYCDWNSTSPAVKRQVATRVLETGARFVDGAVMAAVPPHRQAVPVLLSGDGAAEFVSAVDGLGMCLEVLGPVPGAASAVKMFRSLLVKGLEALVVECLAGAERFGVAHRVLDSMTGSLPVHDWTELADYLLRRSVTHGQRRAEELRQVADTLREVGVEPLLADAGARRLRWFADLTAQSGLATGQPDDAGAVLAGVLAWLAEAAPRTDPTTDPTTQPANGAAAGTVTGTGTRTGTGES